MLRNRCFQEMRELAIYSHLSIEDETPLGSGRQCMVSKHTNDMTTVQFCTIISFYIYHINNNRLQMVLPVWGFEWQHHCSIKLHPPDIITGTACVKCRTSQNIRMSEFIRHGLGQSRGGAEQRVGDQHTATKARDLASTYVLHHTSLDWVSQILEDGVDVRHVRVEVGEEIRAQES